MKKNFFIGIVLIFLATGSPAFGGPIDHLIAYYPFDGNAADMTGNGNNGTVFGAALTADRFGNPNSAYKFDGINDYIDLGNNPSLKPGLPIAIEAWVRLDSTAVAPIFNNDFAEDS
jgi:hypothetical protein